MTSSIQTLVQTVSISTSLIAAGGIATLSLFDIPILKSQPASRSLPSTRWLFSRGSHTFPQAAAISASGFMYLAFTSLKPSQPALDLILKIASNGAKVNGFLAAAGLCLSIAPWTSLVMIPTNFALIKKNEEYGGLRSGGSAKAIAEQGGRIKPGKRSAEDSVNGEGEGGHELLDLSGPQEKTGGKTTAQEDEEVQRLLEKFGLLNWARAVLIGAGGVCGLVVALS